MCVYFLFLLCAWSGANIKMMLRLLLLTLLLTVKAAMSDINGSGYGEFSDDEIEEEVILETTRPPIGAEKVMNQFENPDDGNMTIIIIAAVIVGALTILSIIAVVLFKRHLQRREQGVYSVPVEQGEKGV
ncbi:uncharacterized protein si:dkey-262k9.2 isoform X1 [Silurus meridionalis]|uniref:uncharacterized protein si:dkey-262k9.2 isoform X1 n=2 Tax=Silurus meridionalis TaxID=175797 RepID=UPI001EEA3036|nr:uncharacterized protein si:dkey-262k9.2 isoform X1 [Silurus meridionalis]